MTVRELIEILRNLGFTESLVEGSPDGSGTRIDVAVEQILSTLTGAYQIHETHQVLSEDQIQSRITEAIAAASTPAQPAQTAPPTSA